MLPPVRRNIVIKLRAKDLAANEEPIHFSKTGDSPNVKSKYVRAKLARSPNLREIFFNNSASSQYGRLSNFDTPPTTSEILLGK